MKKIHIFLKQNINYFIIMAVAFAALSILFFRSPTVGHDTKFHVGNIIELTNQIKENPFFPSKVYGNIGTDFGYGTGIFYPQLPHLSVAYINTIINNPSVSMKIVYFFALFLSGVTMYNLAKRITKKETLALVSAVIYMLFPYHLSNIYIRDAFSENFLFIFLPMILSGLYELFNGNYKKFYLLFILGMVGGVLSHLTMMIYFTILIIIFLLIRFKDTIKNIKHFTIASVIILLIISPFVLPMIENKMLGNYRVFQDLVMVEGTWGNGLIPYRYLNYNVAGPLEIRYYIDVICLILFVISMIKYNKYKNKTYDYIILFAVISFIISTILFPWDIFPRSFRMFQYPWRFETFVALFLSLLAPLCLEEVKSKKIFYILIIIMTIFSFDITNYNNWNFLNLEDASIKEVAMGWQKEYLPVKTYENIDYYNSRNHEILVKEGLGEAKIISSSVPKLEFTVSNEVTVELPRLYYVGYTLKDDKNNTYYLEENINGFIETKLNAGNYTLNYTGTKIDNICKYLSFIGIISLIGLQIKKDKKLKK